MSHLTPDELIARYLDDTASEEEMKRLNGLLVTSADVRANFLSAIEQAVALGQGLGVKPQEAGIRNTIPFLKLLVVAACMAFFVTISYFFWPHPMAEITAFHGEYEVPSDPKLSSGDTLKTIGSASFLEFQFQDGTEVRLAGNTVATVTEGPQKRLVVHRGSASLDVEPQPVGAPLIVVTPTAELTVRGTSFGVHAAGDKTQLEVAEGAVDFKRLVDGRSVRVGAGEYSVAGDRKRDFGAKPIPELTTAWSLDLKKDPEATLARGKAELDADGNVIGARAAPGEASAERIVTQNAWALADYGLFRVEKASVMKMRLKMDTPQWFNLVVVYRSPEPGSSEAATCLYQDPSWWEGLEPGEWHTVEAPLLKPKKMGEYLGDLEEVPLNWLGFMISVGAGDENRGLVIERIWTE